ncbi:hypothetical protein TNCV_4621671 [Trichonephila clavipes]|nr:hypothetical protein TNCV_4621671 [Trichonephila clavipes]
MFIWRGSVEGVERDIYVSTRLSFKHVVIEAAGCFCRGGVILERSVGSCSATCLSSSFDILPRDRVPDPKYVLMWMDLQSNGECLQRKERTSEDR